MRYFHMDATTWASHNSPSRSCSPKNAKPFLFSLLDDRKQRFEKKAFPFARRVGCRFFIVWITCENIIFHVLNLSLTFLQIYLLRDKSCHNQTQKGNAFEHINSTLLVRAKQQLKTTFCFFHKGCKDEFFIFVGNSNTFRLLKTLHMFLKIWISLVVDVPVKKCVWLIFRKRRQ